MTNEEAKQALKEGKRVANCDWKRNEYIELAKVPVYVDESGQLHGATIFLSQNTDEWEIVE